MLLLVHITLFKYIHEIHKSSTREKLFYFTCRPVNWLTPYSFSVAVDVNEAWKIYTN